MVPTQTVEIGSGGMNAGKKFEKIIKKCIPEYCFYYRLPDPPQSYYQTDSLRFSWKNPCDAFVFDTNNRLFYALELKSTQSKSMTFEDINLDKQTRKMIHKEQILALLEMSKYSHTIAGFIFNFRDEATGIERTYFQKIEDFMTMIGNISKKSFNEIDLIKNNHITLQGERKRKNANYTWDIDTMFKTMKV